MPSSSSGDASVRLWDAASGAELLCLEGHGSPVTSVAFSPDGARLASGSVDGSVRFADFDGTSRFESIGLPRGWVVYSEDGTLRCHGGEFWRYVYALVEDGDTVRVTCPDDESMQALRVA